MNKKITTSFAIALAVLIVGVGGYVFGTKSNQSQTPFVSPSDSIQPLIDRSSTMAAPGTAFLFGRISNLANAAHRTVVTIDLAEVVHGKDAQEQAAFVDGVCTLEQIESNTCLNNPVYVRKTEKSIQLAMSKDADVRLYARDAAGGMKIDADGQLYYEQIPEQDFAAMLENTADAPWIKDIPYDFTTKQGMIVSVKESYAP
jgi:hypothetical protein